MIPILCSSFCTDDEILIYLIFVKKLRKTREKHKLAIVFDTWKHEKLFTSTILLNSTFSLTVKRA